MNYDVTSILTKKFGLKEVDTIEMTSFSRKLKMKNENYRQKMMLKMTNKMLSKTLVAR